MRCNMMGGDIPAHTHLGAVHVQLEDGALEKQVSGAAHEQLVRAMGTFVVAKRAASLDDHGARVHVATPSAGDATPKQCSCVVHEGAGGDGKVPTWAQVQAAARGEVRTLGQGVIALHNATLKADCGGVRIVPEANGLVAAMLSHCLQVRGHSDGDATTDALWPHGTQSGGGHSHTVTQSGLGRRTSLESTPLGQASLHSPSKRQHLLMTVWASCSQ